MVLHDNLGRSTSAYIHGDELHFNMNSPQAVLGAVAHEATHFMEKYSPKDYAALKAFIKSELTESKFEDLVGAKSWEYLGKDKKQLTEQERTNMEGEVVAQLCEKMLSDEDQLYRFAQKDTKAAKTLLSKLEEAVVAIKNAMKGATWGRLNTRDLEQSYKAFDLWMTGLSNAIEKAENTPVQTDETADGIADAYSLNDSEVASIKMQIKMHEKVLGERPIAATVKRKQFESKASLLRELAEVLGRNGQTVYKKGYGDIVLGRRQIRNGSEHLRLYDKYESSAFLVIVKVLKQGIEIGRSSNHGGVGQNTITFGAPIEVIADDGTIERVNVGVVVIEERRNYYHAHRAILPDDIGIDLNTKKTAPITSVASDKMPDVVATKSAVLGKIPQVLDGVKPVERNSLVNDATYLDLARKPKEDRKKLQEMVDAAAKAAGYTIRAYHHSNNQFTVFDRSRARKSMDIDGFFFAPENDPYNEYGDNVISAYLKLENPAINPKWEYGVYSDSGTRERKKLIEEGYDGVISQESDGTVYEYMVFDSDQAKSSDPVTYDDNGKVIPLSERFNSKNSDIRYSLVFPDADAALDILDGMDIDQLQNCGNISHNYKTNKEATWNKAESSLRYFGHPSSHRCCPSSS